MINFFCQVSHDIKVNNQCNRYQQDRNVYSIPMLSKQSKIVSGDFKSRTMSIESSRNNFCVFCCHMFLQTSRLSCHMGCHAILSVQSSPVPKVMVSGPPNHHSILGFLDSDSQKENRKKFYGSWKSLKQGQEQNIPSHVNAMQRFARVDVELTQIPNLKKC